MSYIQLILPVLLLLLAVAFLRPGVRLWRRIGGVALIALFLCSWGPFAALSLFVLERPYPVAVPAPQDVGAIVVLSGGVFPPDLPQMDPVATQSTYVRCRYAAWLYQHWRTVPVFASGGKESRGRILADVMRRALEAEGVPAAAIVTEGNSTSTYTNAVFTSALLRARGIRKIALVTEAFHMRRAELCFRKQGLEVVAAPCAFRGAVFSPSWDTWIPQTKALAWSGDALHEWVGIAWYRISGKM